MNINRDMEENTYRQGFLQRKRAVSKSVRKRWFCLMSDALVTFKSEEDAKNAGECIDVLPLVDVQTVKRQHTNSQRYPFEIITRQKTHVFLTDSPYEQDQWVKAFHTAMQLRCFNTQKDEVAAKYSGLGKNRRSSAGTKKLSQFKKYVQDGWRPSGIQRKSSGVDCDASEAEYQGIPIGNEGTDEVFEVKRSISQSSKSPQIVQYVTVHEDGIENNGTHGQSRASDDSGQGYHDVLNLDSIGNNAQDGESTNGASSERSKSASTKTKTIESASNGSVAASSWPTTPSVPPPVPAPAARNRSTKRVFEDEKIYDEPCREDGIYDVPPREAEESVPSAMGDLQKIINECSDEQEKSDIVLERGPKQTEFSSQDEPTASLEEEMTHQGVRKSAMDDLKNLFDSLEEL